MNSAFLNAVASYYGLDGDAIRKSEWFTDGPDTLVVFELRVADDDMIGVLERMKEMRAAEPVVEQAVLRRPMTYEEAVARFGPQYDALLSEAKAEYGSRGAYINAMTGGEE